MEATERTYTREEIEAAFEKVIDPSGDGIVGKMYKDNIGLASMVTTIAIISAFAEAREALFKSRTDEP